MADEMGTFRIDFEIENPLQPAPKRIVTNALVEGLNLRVEPSNRRLVDAGPAPAAVVSYIR